MGDVHADFGFVRRCIDRAQLSGCDALVALGDWGAHWQALWSQSFTASVREALEDSPVPLYWCRGNHDNAAYLSALVEDHGDDKPIEITSNYYYLPDGLRWQLGSSTIGVLGGEFSVDWRGRTPYVSWWPEELPSAVAVERLGTERVDLLLTHGPPELPDDFVSGWELPPQDQDKQDVARILIRKALRQTRPTNMAHGHLHRRYRDTFIHYGDDEVVHETQVIGLSNGDARPFSDAVVVYNLDTNSFLLPTPAVLDVSF